MIHLPSFHRRYRATLWYIAVVATGILLIVAAEAFGWIR